MERSVIRGKGSRKIICVMLALLLLFVVMDPIISVRAEPQDENVTYYGDVDEDGSVTADDALTVLKHDVGLERIMAERSRTLADMDKNGSITSDDALQILKTDVGLIEPVLYIEAADNPTDDPAQRQYKINITIGDNVLTAALVQNSSTDALLDMLAEGPITIDMNDYANMEKVGPFPASLPRNDEQIMTEAGDLILYQGNSFVIYYDTNSWNFTRLGKIENVTQQELKEILGSGSVTAILSLPSNAKPEEKENIQIRMAVGETELYATLEDNATMRVLMEQMPMTLPMSDLYGREMCYCYGANDLPTDSLRSDGYEIGDIAYWPQRGSLVILYEQNGEQFERQHLGHIDSGVEIFENTGDADVTFEVVIPN